jgi:two-component system cell cycle sensor histidine kinase/response regulator CckA
VLWIQDHRTEQPDSAPSLFHQFGYDVQTASRGRQGLEIAVARPPALILIDIILPDMSGIELCSLMRAEPKLDTVPILLTGRVPSDSFSVREGLNAGADDYVEMPYTTMTLLAKTARLVERRRAEAKLRKREAQLAETQRLAHIGSFEWDILADEWTWSDELFRIFGLEPQSRGVSEELSSRHVTDEVRAAVMAVFEKPDADHKPCQIEHSILRADGTTRILQVRADAVLDEAGSPIKLIGTSQDITELKRSEEALRRIEEQLLHSQKMEAIGQLAGGVAHDFNNLLTIIGGYSDLTFSQMDPADPLRRYIGAIRQAVKDAKTLTRQLPAFGRRQVLQQRVIDLNTLITELASMLSRLIGPSIELKTVLAEDLESVKADPGQVEQVILNLVVNARDAMPDGGNLTIETRNVYLDEAYTAAPEHTKPGNYAMIAVSDTGCGISESNRARIFEPFFTTKEANKGRGLGLSTVYGIVTQSDGYIWFYSEVDQGTTFRIYLPRVDGKPVGRQRRVETPELARGDKAVLLVENEELLRDVIREMLESVGYHVIDASQGGEAISYCEQRSGPIDLLLTDVVMPEMSGRVLAEEVRKIRPGIRVLYMSGYTKDAIARHALIDGGAHFIEKPFSEADLARKLREMLP